MALPAELENLLSMITDEKVREATRKTLTDNHESGLRQEDYSRKMNEVQARQKEYDAQHQKYLTWYKDADTEYRSAQQRARAAEQEKAALAEKVAQLERVKSASDTGDIELTAEEEHKLARELKAARAEASQAATDLSALKAQLAAVNDRLEKQTLTREFYDQDVRTKGDSLGMAILDVIDKQDQYRRDYGKTLDRNQLLSEAHKRNGDIDAAYDFLVQKDKEAKLRSDIEAEYDKKYQERLKSSNLPIEQGGGEPTMGPLQTRLMQSASKEKNGSTIPEDIAADGSGKLAYAAAQDLRQQGKV